MPRVHLEITGLNDAGEGYPKSVEVGVNLPEDLTANEMADRLVDLCRAVMAMATYHPDNIAEVFSGYEAGS